MSKNSDLIPNIAIQRITRLNFMTKEEFFNRYEMNVRQGRLGGGAFGTVYKAYDNILDSWKAIKISEVKFIEGKEFSLISEFDATKSLPDHKNIANYEAVYQFQMPNGLFDYAIMQYYPEGNLKQLLSNRQLTEAQKREIALGLIKGVDYLHSNKVIHRDLKPSNILISKKSESYIPKIADFGLAKAIEGASVVDFTNSFGGGTLEYSAPEQLLGHKLNMNSDLWAVGVILFEIFLGNIPFESGSKTVSAEAKRRLIYQNIVNTPTPKTVENCPFPFNLVIKSCLQKNPKERVSSAEELLDLINRNPVDLAEANEETTILGSAVSDKSASLKERKKEDQLSEKIKQKEERERVEADRLRNEEEERIRLEKERKKREEERLEAERKQKEKEEKLRIEEERKAEEERERVEAERLRKEEEERISLERERKEREKKEEEEARKKEEVRKAKEERERMEAERFRSEKEQKERKEKERLEAEKKRKEEEEEQKRNEEERIAKEARERTNAERLRQKEKVSIPLDEDVSPSKRRISLIWLLFLVVLSGGVLWKVIPFINNSGSLQQNELSEHLIKQTSNLDELSRYLQETDDQSLKPIIEQRITTVKTEIDNRAWDEASTSDSLTAYQNYIDNYPNGIHYQKALDEIDRILSEVKMEDEDELWNMAERVKAKSAYQKYLSEYPEGKFSDQARQTISNIDKDLENQIWRKAQERKTKLGYQDYLRKYPNGIYSDEANQSISDINNKLLESRWAKVDKGSVSDLEEFMSQNPESKFEAEANSLLAALSSKSKTPTAQTDLKSDVKDWDKMSNSINPQDFISFINNYPDSEYLPAARNRLDSLSWIKVKEDNKVRGYHIYLESFPNGAFREEAEKELDRLLLPFLKDMLKWEKLIPAGKFKFGCDENEQKCDDVSSYEVVSVGAFRMSKYEVTQAQYIAVMNNNPSFFNDCHNCPVENVSWNDAMAFINTLNSMENNPFTFRLPTEKEWEYAAEGGDSFRFSGSNDLSEVGVYKSNSQGGTASVGSKKPNSFLLSDMSGNVAEWCTDGFTPNEIDKDSIDLSLNFKVLKGGSWNDRSTQCGVNNRGYAPANDKNKTIGFRLVRDIK